MVYVGIDFSLNSTSICVESDGVEYFYNIIRPTNVTKKVLNVMDDLNIDYRFTTNFIKDLDYSNSEIDKLNKSIEIADMVVDILSGYQDIILGCEGLSYGNKGSRALDIAGFHYILRYYISSMMNIKKCIYIPPKEIKKYAIHGNADKKRMFDSYKELNVDNILSSLISKLNISDDIKNIPKPVDDMIDAFYIKNFVKKI